MDVGEETNAPEITLEPADYPSFQANILSGEGFVIRIRDEDGIKDNDGHWMLDWDTLRLYLNGVEITTRFVTTALDNNILTWAETEQEVSLFVNPDPKQFMTEHDVFSVPWNGNHWLRLSICDTNGLCGSRDYEIYFGPFALVGPVTKISCYAEESCWVFFDYAALGNIGIDSGKNSLFLVFNKKGTSDYISLTDCGWQDGIKPLFSGISIPTGSSKVVSDWVTSVPRFMNGNLICFIGVIDEESGACQLGFQEFDLNCGSQ